MDESFERIESNGVHGNGNGAVPTGDGAPAADERVGRLPAILESLLLAAGGPVPLGQLIDALDGPGRAEVLAALEALEAGYEREARGLRLVRVAGGYQLRTPPEHAPWIRRLLHERPPRLSRPMLETLAIVAYRQPVTKSAVERIRGVDSDYTIRSLLHRRLVVELGRAETPGRPFLYGTGFEFLERFGLTSLEDLPPLDVEVAARLVDDETAAPEANGHHANGLEANGQLEPEPTPG
jgi:segregation and condensation protein B